MRCAYCNAEIKSRRANRFCGPICYNAFRDKEIDQQMLETVNKTYDNTPMPKTQALINAYLTDRSLDSLDDLTSQIFDRPVTQD